MKFSTGMQIKTNIKENTVGKKHSNVFSKPLNSKASKLREGFSFVELIVAVAIMAIITSVVLFRQSKFSSDILITNMTYEIALAIRQAQVYGISSRQNAACTGSLCSDDNKYKVGYGVYFEPETGGLKPNSYTEFIDFPTNIITIGDDALFNYYYNDPATQHQNTSTLAQGHIKQYCAYNTTSSVKNCGPENDMVMNIVFVKPNPDAHITTGTKGGGVDGIDYDKAKIVVESALGDKCRTVTVYGSGQISVDPINPDADGCDSL